MGFGVRTGKPPDSGESAAADLKEQWLRAHNSLAVDEVIALGWTGRRVGRGARALLRITEEGGRYA
jgi:hypothetical protein